MFDARGQSTHASAVWTSEAVIREFENAMTVMRDLPDRGHSTRLAQLAIKLPTDRLSCASSDGRLKPPVPKPGEIDRMDDVLRWLALIPESKRVLRKIIGLRSQTSFATGRPMAWKAVARAVNADATAVKAWHQTGIRIITDRLNASRIAPR